MPVIAVETEGADSYAKSLNAGRLVELANISSIATTLGARIVCAQALAYSKNHRIESVVLPDKLAVSASLQFLKDHGTVVEPACGVALAAVYEKVAALSGYKTILVIVCGGVLPLMTWLSCHVGNATWHNVVLPRSTSPRSGMTWKRETTFFRRAREKWTGLI